MKSFTIILVLAVLLAACSSTPRAPQAAVTLIPDSEPSADTTTFATSDPANPATNGSVAAPEDVQSVTEPGSNGGEILFLRGGTLIALDMTTRQERTVAEDVREFVAAPDGRSLALVRGTGRGSELWQVARDGNSLVQLTSNNRVEGSISWSQDGTTLAYASADTAMTHPLAGTFEAWPVWCSVSEVRLLDTDSLAETTLEPGCDPAFSPDGTRIAFATPPTRDEIAGIPGPDMFNTIRLVNRQGENGWSFATTASEEGSSNGLLLYAPVWSPDSQRLAYYRFMGEQALTDINYLEMAPATEGNGELINYGVGWLKPALFAPDAQQVTTLQNDWRNTRGLSGYAQWRANVLRLDTPGEITLPEGERPVPASIVDSLPMVTGAAWAPDSTLLAIVLPAGWNVDIRDQASSAQFQGSEPGDLWLWAAGKAPGELLVQGVDVASPVVWLPPVGVEPVAQSEPRAFPTAAPASATPTQSAPGSATDGGDILFLREGVLTAYAIATGQERQIATDVRSFAATPDGQWLALVRTTGGTSDIWITPRDGSDLRQVTSNPRIEWSLSWSRDGTTLAYASADAAEALPQPLTEPDWITWAGWCGASDIRVLDTASGVETALEPGCQPALSLDGLRIVFATPPTEGDPAISVTTPTVQNAIRLINSQGQNAWNFATAGEQVQDPDTDVLGSGKLVYAPAWSPDHRQIAYHRFIGYQALVDINIMERGDSFEGSSTMLGAGAGWMLPLRFAPDGSRLVAIEHNYSDARGSSGYDVWRAQVLDLSEQGELFLPTGTFQTSASIVHELPRATSAAWAPDSSALVVTLPAGWSADISTEEPVFNVAAPGDLWLWSGDDDPSQRLVQGVDFASPLLWLPPL